MRLIFTLFLSLLPGLHMPVAYGFPAIVQTDKVIATTITPTITVPGTVISRDDVHLSMETTGIIHTIRELGETVQTGDILAEIDNTRYQLELKNRGASLLPIGARLRFYQQEVERLKKLEKANHAAKNELDRARAERDALSGEYKRIQVEIDQAKDQLKRTQIRAPFEGIIVERFKELGEYVNPGDEVMRLVNHTHLEIQAYLPQYIVSFIQAHQKIGVLDQGKHSMAAVRTLVPVGNPASRLYELRLQLDHRNWLPGYALRVVVPAGESRQVNAVPRDALVIRREGIRVFRINDERIAEMIPVTTGIANHDHIEIIGNIQAGDQVVIRGNERLTPGQNVQPQQ